MPDTVLYHRDLDLFLACVHTGSFTKAARRLFMTPTALMKRMNRFEETIGAPLFERSKTGLTLTPAGRALANAAPRLIDCAAGVLQEVRRSARTERQTINIGTSPVINGQYVINWWARVHRQIPDIDVRLVPFENTLQKADEILFNFGREIDMVAGVFDPAFLSRYGCKGLVLENVPIGCVVPLKHALSGKSRLRLEELVGQQVLVLKHGVCEDFDRAADYLRSHFPGIDLREVPTMNLEAFNEAEHLNQIVLTIKYWSEVHPLFNAAALDWSMTARFGFIYSQRSSPGVEHFIKAVKAAML